MNLFGFGKRDTNRVSTNGNNTVSQQDKTPVPVSEAVQNAQGQWEQDYKVWNGSAYVIEKYIYNGTDWVKAPVVATSHVVLDKIPDTEQGISLKKSVISLDKSLISLEKKSGYSFENHKAKVAVVLDYSGSMSNQYRSGKIQNLLTRLMPLALKFDDNGELDVWIFDDKYERIESMTLNNFDTFVKNEILSLNRHMGCTSYSPVLKDVLKKYFKEDVATSDIPSFVIFITDGSNDDKRETDKVIIKSSHKNIFIQFVGTGEYEEFSYLRKLDDLSGRPVDNTGFIRVKDMHGLGDEELFNMLLEQYPDWLKEKRI